MTVLTTPSDDELLRLMLAGDESAFVTLYRRRQGGIYRFALQMSGSPAIAEDVTQEVFMVLMSDLKNYDPAKGSLSAYLYGIARNHVLRSLSRDRSFVSIGDSYEEEGETTHEQLISQDDPLGDLTRSEVIESVRQAVTALPAHYREVVVLCDLHEMSYAEAAQILNCAVGTIRSRLHRARALLIEKLRANKEPDTASRPVNPARCFA
ncbi:MAG: polymerase sigma-70 factor, subfamily [Acidobacteriota bacterium]|jgi:RNA polymerase sigma-70 factor (ECF subfamily)|nr:polymerase sigma-70 factor, subfamily [Acidobacteriota bacterium]